MKEVTIKSTTEYDMFKDIMSNREVDRKHVRQLVRAIEKTNLLHLNPIIVNSNMEVVDGQHRLQAAEELQVPIYYVIDDTIDKSHIAGLNSNQKNWSMLDYVNYFAVERRPEYLQLSDIINRYPYMPVSTILLLSSADGGRNRLGFKEGRIDMSQYQRAIEVGELVNKIRNIGVELAYDRSFILALAAAYKVEGFNPDQLVAKIGENRAELYKCAKTDQYINLLDVIYNKRQHYRLRLN